ncbi:MAG: hypothetical protein AAB658_10625 [Chloroflexota bacterium]
MSFRHAVEGRGLLYRDRPLRDPHPLRLRSGHASTTFHEKHVREASARAAP